MTRAAAVIFVSLSSVASASTLEEYGPHTPLQSAISLRRSGCEIDVDLRGGLATVEVREFVANEHSADPLAAVVGFSLPDGASLASFAVRDGSGPPRAAALGPVLRAVPVAAGSRDAVVESADVLGADPALLRAVGDRDYEISVQPIAPGHFVQLLTTYAMPVTPRAGALRFVVPGRDAAGDCRGSVRITPGPGARVRGVRLSGGRTAGAATNAVPFVLAASDLAIDVELDIAGNQPIVWTQTQAVTGGKSATLLTVLGPQIKAADPRRVVLLVDTSRSMDLVGRPRIAKLIDALGTALPSNAQLETILFDRKASRVFGDLRPVTAPNLAAIQSAFAKRPAINGSDLVGAFALAKQIVDGSRDQTMLVVITDGVSGQLRDQALIDALGGRTSRVDVHAIVIDPAHTTSPGATALRAPVNLYGGAYVEVGADDLDDALSAIDGWLRPSWLELALGDHQIPSELRSGAGFTRLIEHTAPLALALRGHGATPFAIAPRPAPAAPALAALVDPGATAQRSLAVLATTGRVAKSRAAMVAGGGRYERSVALAEPPRPTTSPSPAAPRALPSAISPDTLVLMFRNQLQPKAYACYQRALGKNTKLGGTVVFQLRVGRGEISDAVLARGSGDADFDRCLLEAAYLMTPPLPDFTVNADDQTIANYPLTFSAQESKPVVVLGDADSESPIDISSVQGGVPVRGAVPPRTAPRGPAPAPDTKTPLGNLRPPKDP